MNDLFKIIKQNVLTELHRLFNIPSPADKKQLTGGNKNATRPHLLQS